MTCVETVVLGGRRRQVVARDWCRGREEEVIAEEEAIRRRYGRGETAVAPMPTAALVEAWRKPKVGPQKQEVDEMGWKRISDAEIMAAMADAGVPQSIRQIAQAIGRSDVCVASHISRMVEEGVLEVVTGSTRAGRRGGYPATYKLSDTRAQPKVRPWDAAVDAVRDRGRASTSEVAAAVGVCDQTVLRMLSAAEEAGIIERRGRDRKGGYTWAPADNAGSPTPVAEDPVPEEHEVPPSRIDALRESVTRAKAAKATTTTTVESEEAAASGKWTASQGVTEKATTVGAVAELLHSNYQAEADFVLAANRLCVIRIASLHPGGAEIMEGGEADALAALDLAWVRWQAARYEIAGKAVR